MAKGSEISVFLRLGQYPHGAYQDLAKCPPKGVRYTVDTPSGKPTAERKISHKLKLSAWKVISRTTIPVAVVNAGDCQLVHSTNNFIPITKKPWLVDSEHVWGLFGFYWNRLGSPYYNWQFRTLLSASNCKGVLAWSDKANATIRKVAGEKLAGKVRTIRPVAAPRPVVKRKARDDARFLFVGKRFYEKGGADLLAAYETVRKKTDATLTIISDVPAPVLEKYSRFKDIIFEKPAYSHDQLSETFYQKSSVFVFPTYVDTYGMVAIEAMAHGLPVISTDCLAMPELVKDGRNGFIVKRPFSPHDSDGFFLEKQFPQWGDLLGRIEKSRDKRFSAELAKDMLRLSDDAGLWNRMSRNCVEDSHKGRLSVGNRNRLLLEAYEDALA